MIGIFGNSSELIPFNTDSHKNANQSAKRLENLIETLNDLEYNNLKDLENTLPDYYLNNNEDRVSIMFYEMKTLQKFVIKIPSKIHGYEIIRLLGKGSFSVVVLLKKQKTGELFAAKIFSIEDMEHKNEVDSIKKETIIIKKFNHKNIIKYHDSFTIKKNGIKKYYVLVIDYYENNLTNAIKTNQINGTNIKKIIFGIAKAVDYVHLKGFSHGDIKPDNILLDSEFNPILCDFGFATNSEFSSSTRCTPHYAAPELINMKTEPFNPKIADIWSLGVTFYTIAKRMFPYDYLKPFKQEFLNEKISFINDNSLQSIIGKCLRINVNERASIKDILHDSYFEYSLY